MPPPFFGPGPGLFGALVTGAVVGGAVAAASRPPPPGYGPYGPYRGRRHRVIVVREPPRGTTCGPNEVMVLVTCPQGAAPGTQLEIEVEGRAYRIVVPRGVHPGQQFYAKVPKPAPQVYQAKPASQQQQQVYQASYSSQGQTPQTQAAMPVATSVADSSAPIAEVTVQPSVSQANPFGPSAPSSSSSSWVIAPMKPEFDTIFNSAGPAGGKLSPAKVREVLVQTGLPLETLRSVWELSDMDKDGHLDQDEFAVAYYLCRQAQAGKPMPATLPADVVPPSKRSDPNPF